MSGATKTTGPGTSRTAPEPRWRLVDHICRHCRGRLLTRNQGRRIIVRCAKCGAEEEGGHEALCCCGIEVKGHGRMFECIRNPERSPGFPAEIVMREKPWTPPPATTRPRRPVRVPEP
jgi:hypothetical protein